MTKNVYKARAPLRLGLGGGGTDVSPYCDTFGGAVINVTISRYANASVEDNDNDEIEFESADLGLYEVYKLDDVLEISGVLVLHKATYVTICDRYLGGQRLPIKIVTDVESPMGSGLGSSSAVVVSIVMALKERFALALDPYTTAQLCYEIEREVAGFAGGKQDQYASTFGGVNFIEFGNKNEVLVSPLRVRPWILNELESSLILCFTGQSRESARIIDDQSDSVSNEQASVVEGMHQLKRDAISMKKHLLLGDFDKVAEILNASWEAKKATSLSISNDKIDGLILAGRKAGAMAAKVSGAGGGGFIFFLVRSDKRVSVTTALESMGVACSRCKIEREGADSWVINQGKV